MKFIFRNKTFFLFLVITFFLSFTVRSYGQRYLKKNEFIDSFSSDSSLQLYINPTLLSEKEKGIFINALSAFAIRKDIYDTLKIKPYQSVYSIIKENYNFNEKTNFKTASILKEKVKEINSLNDKYFLLTGDLISTPVIPTNPYKTSSDLFTQVFDFINYKSFISPTKSLINSSESVVAKNIQQENAGLWMYNITYSDLKNILDSIPIELQKKLYGTAFVTVNEPEFVEINFPTSLEKDSATLNSNEVIPSLSDVFSKIPLTNFGSYYVLDFFDGSNCTHGKKVLSVISQRLKEYGLDTVKIKIIPIPINYFQNQDSAIAFLKKYYASDKLPRLTKIEGEATINALKKIKDQNLKKCENCIPEIYLDACMKYYYGKNPDIISTSFFITTFRDIMPNFVNSPTNLITACLNEPGRKIEDLQERESTSNGSPNGAIQPLYSSWTNYAKVGSIIVGCQLDDGKFYGMYSSNGEGITTLGKGIGWGSNEDCLKPSEKGASFATPDVAIKLLLAKAYWRSTHFTPNAIESRTRLLLCSDLDKAFVGKFASAGLPNLSKLIFTSDGFIEDNKGEILECSFADSSFIEYDQNSKNPFIRGPKGISGLTFIDGEAYAFFESSLAWKHIKIKNLSIVVSNKWGTEIFNSIDKLISKYKQLIKLKNQKT